MGKDYACDGMLKLNVENNKASTSSVYMLSSINFWYRSEERRVGKECLE